MTSARKWQDEVHSLCSQLGDKFGKVHVWENWWKLRVLSKVISCRSNLVPTDLLSLGVLVIVLLARKGRRAPPQGELDALLSSRRERVEGFSCICRCSVTFSFKASLSRVVHLGLPSPHPLHHISYSGKEGWACIIRREMRGTDLFYICITLAISAHL